MVYVDAYGALRTEAEIFHIESTPGGVAINLVTLGEGEVIKVADYESADLAEQAYDEASQATSRNYVLSILMQHAKGE